MQHIRKQAKAIAWLFSLIYFASYLMRINFATMLAKICESMDISKVSIAGVVTGLTLAYGLGQVINGFVGDKIKPQLLLTIGLLLAACCNTAMFFATTVPVMTVIWTVNGFAHSMMWPPLVRLMSTYLNDVEYGYAAVRVSWGSSIATIVLYLLCPALLLAMEWRSVMLVCAGVGVLILVLWLALNPKLLKDPVVVSKATAFQKGQKAGNMPLPAFVVLPVILIMLGIIFQGSLRDGVTNWMPSYLSDAFGISAESAIITAVIPAIFSILSFALFDLLHRKVFKNEVFCAAMIFIGSACCAVVLYLVNCFVQAPVLSIVLSALMMGLIIAFMHGINLMLITVVPKRFIKSGKVSTYSGLLNACTYVGAAIGTPLFAAMLPEGEAQGGGPGVLILMWALISVLGVAACLAAVPLWKKFRRDYADAPVELVASQDAEQAD